MTPATTAVAPDTGLAPPALPHLTADLQVFVYDPTDPTRNGEVYPAGMGRSSGLIQALRVRRPVAVIPLDTLYSIELAAEFLNVPAAEVRRAVAERQLPAANPDGPGIRFADILAYRESRRAACHRALDELVEVERELGLRD